MVSIMTSIRLKEGSEREWDEAMRERMAAAGRQPGWIGGQLLQPEDSAPHRIIVGTWQSRDDWVRWHDDPQFARTREELDGLTAGPEEHTWSRVTLDVRAARQARPAGRAQRAPGRPAKGAGKSGGKGRPAETPSADLEGVE
jgi:heme-degrading monooxygenase HmoA